MRKGRDRDDLDLPFESYKIVGVVKDGRKKDNPCRPINKASINF